MKKFTLSFVALLSAGFASPVAANDLMVAASMQRCTTNEECALVTASCQDNCGFVPVNKENMPALQSQYQARCGKPVEANPTCNMNPPLSAACINSRCTIDYAYKNNASAGDYQSGAYAVPEAPVPSQVKGDYSKVNDRVGFTAYDLPQNEIKEKTVGTLHTTVYVPPSAPVSGGNYVPVTGSAVPSAAPSAVAPAAPAGVPAQAMPTNHSHATPPSVVPTYAPAVSTPAYQVPTPPPAPVPVPPPVLAPMAAPAAPQLIPPATPSNIPAMTPSMPNLPPPLAAPAQPYQYVAPETVVTAPQPPQPQAVPVAPPGSKPIPPSDLKPAPSLVPPAGGTIPVNPEDPGAPPPQGSTVMLKDGNLGMTGVATGKDFSAQKKPSEAKAKKVGSYN